jgi:hypothetical protein
MTFDASSTSSPPLAAHETKKKRKLKPGMGKSKGSGFESTIAKTLTKALQPLNFIRTPGSGARVGGKNFATIGAMFGEDALKVFVGDVVPVNERQHSLRFLHSVETKFYAATDNFTSLVAGKANILKWYEEAVVDAAKIDKVPMLICKWNHTPIFVVVELTGETRAHQAMASSLAAANLQPSLSLLTYGTNFRALDIFELEALLKVPGFWYQPT